MRQLMGEYAITPEFLKSYRDWANQRQATTGIAPRPEDLQALAEANLATQAANRYKDRALQMDQQRLDMQKDAIAGQERAAAISGVTGLASAGAMTYGVGKSLGWWGASEAGAAEAGGLTAGFGTIDAGGAALATEGAAAGGAGGAAGGTALSGALPFAGTAAIGVGGYMIGSQIGGGRGKTVSGIAGSTASGALAGTYIFPGVGTVIGGAIGFVSGVISDVADSIICSELFRQGLITERQRRYARIYGKQVGEEVYNGYLVVAEPIVNRMRRSRSFTQLVAFFAIPAIKEMSHRVHPRNKGSLFGSIVLHFGIKHSLKAYDRLEGAYDGIPV